MAAPMTPTYAVRNYFYFRQRQFRSLFFSRKRSYKSPWEHNLGGKVVVDLEERPIEISTGQYARFAQGSAVAKQGDTTVMVTATSKPSKTSQSFLPLTVEYRQKAAAAGRIPTNYLRRELGPTEKEILTSRMIDRSVRPMFPPGFENETQLTCNLMAVDGENSPDVLSINAASAALALSEIPWNGPVGAVRIGYIDNEIVINPTRTELHQSSLDLIVTGCAGQKVVMMEASADNVRIDTLRHAVRVGISKVQNIIAKITELQNLYGKEKQFQPQSKDKEVALKLSSLARKQIQLIFQDYSLDKFERDNALKKVKNATVSQLCLIFPKGDAEQLALQFDLYAKQLFRRHVLENDKRCDGRDMKDLRPIRCEVDMFKPLHGSALFQRGQTQVMCTVTFDSLESAAKTDMMSQIVGVVKEKNFMLHYEFPSYATNELSKPGGQTRRELGHGALAEKALRQVIPDNFPFAIRLTSEVLESNGSSSMATVCGGSLALMDAGVPISQPAAGVAMGLIVDTEGKDDVQSYKILTDILGIEDYMGDMDFKIAGTKSGLTALQLDVKLPGVAVKIIQEAIDQSTDARKEVLKIMGETLAHPRPERKENGPVTETLTVLPADRGKFLGVGGINLKKLTSETGVRVTRLDEGIFQLFGHNQQSMDEAKEMIGKFLAEEKIPELEFGAVYTAKILEIREFGVMIQIHPKMDPVLLHNTQLDTKKVMHPSALGLNVGDDISVKYFGRDPGSGQIRVSRKALQTIIPRIKLNIDTPR